MAQEAGRCLQVHGFVAESGHQENHHLTYMSPEGIRLELHSALVEPFDSTEVNTFLEKCQKDFFENMVTENVMGVDFFLASPSYQAFYLLLHMLQHSLNSVKNFASSSAVHPCSKNTTQSQVGGC